MIIGVKRGDIFKSPNKNLAFAVNSEGFNDAGFAGLVSSKYWNELANTGRKKIGEVLSKKTGEKIFHALVCHSLEKNGWLNADKTITKCLDGLDISEGETISIVLIGGGIIGQLGGADIMSILDGMARSNKKVEIYTL